MDDQEMSMMDAREAFARIRRGPQRTHGAPSTVPTRFADNDQGTVSTALDSDSSYSSSSFKAPQQRTHAVHDRDGNVLAIVHESEAALLPACESEHHRAKGKFREGIHRSSSIDEHECGHTSDCYESIIEPSSFNTSITWQSTDLTADICNWLVTPKVDQKTGILYHRSVHFLQDPKFNDRNLLYTIGYALDQILYESGNLNHLKHYATSRYGISCTMYGAGADRRYLDMRAEDFKGAPSSSPVSLEDDLRGMAEELDGLSVAHDALRRKILDEKKRRAARGDEVEMEHLLRLGIVDVEWADSHRN